MRAAAAAGANPLALKAPHFPPRAKRVIFLFMNGGPSQVDTFDHKPLLQRDHGKPLPFAKPRVQSRSETGNLLRSPWKFQQYGQSGMWVSELFPHVAGAWTTSASSTRCTAPTRAHGGALLELHTGSDTFVRPSMGSWVTYGLGTENQNLPGFVTICPTLAHGGVNNWGSAFLPAAYQGTPLGNASDPGRARRDSVTSRTPSTPRGCPAAWSSTCCSEMNREHLAADRAGPGAGGPHRVVRAGLPHAGRSAGVQDISRRVGRDAEAVRPGRPGDARLRPAVPAGPALRRARRALRPGHAQRRTSGTSTATCKQRHEKNAREVDRPIAGLLHGPEGPRPARRHAGPLGRRVRPHAHRAGARRPRPQPAKASPCGWPAAASRPGCRYGATDDYGYYAVENKVHIHDLHATILHLLGLDHERLTYRYAGRDFRLTDVHGEVVNEILV